MKYLNIFLLVCLVSVLFWIGSASFNLSDEVIVLPRSDRDNILIDKSDICPETTNNAETTGRLSFDPQAQKWIVSGELEISSSKAVTSDNYELLWCRVNPQSGQDELIYLQSDVSTSRTPPLFVKFLFDLDRRQIYPTAPNERHLLASGIQNGPAIEMEFWQRLITVLIESFEFNGVPGQSDIGHIYTTWPCQVNPEIPSVDPGEPIFINHNNRLSTSPSQSSNQVNLSYAQAKVKESLKNEGLQQVMFAVLNNCLYQNNDQHLSIPMTPGEIYQEVYDISEPVPDVKNAHNNALFRDVSSFLIIIQWRDANWQQETKNQINRYSNSNAPENTIALINIERGSSSDLDVYGQIDYPMTAPTIANTILSDNEFAKLKEAIQGGNNQKSRLHFKAIAPFFIDTHAHKYTRLILRSRDGYVSEKIKLDLSLDTRRDVNWLWWGIAILLMIASALFIIMLTVTVGSCIYSSSETAQNRTDQFFKKRLSVGKQ